MTRILLLAAVLFACGPATAKPLRIVSLAPHLTELVYAAGAGAALVGTVEYSDYPAEARGLPRVGDGWRVDAERLLALRPDLVLAWPSGTPQETIARLEALKLRVVSIPTYRLADVPAALRTIGRIAGTSEIAEATAAKFAADVEGLRARYARQPAVSVFIQIDDDPLYTVNRRHVISEVVELCGGRNVFAELPQIAPPVDVEAVLARQPQAILSTDDTIADPAAYWRRWPGLVAVRAGTIYSLSADTLARSTPRLVDGVRATCEALRDARARLDAAGRSPP